MKQLDLKAKYFRPNLRILKNNIITFDDKLIELFDLNGNLLDLVIFKNRNIVNIEIINDNYIIVATPLSILIMKISFNLLEFDEVLKIPINNIFLIKKKNLLLIDSINEIIIFDIINLNEKPIQIIYHNNYNKSCLILNQNIFISYNNENISLYQNIKGTKIYQLSSKLKLIGNKCLTKLNGKLLLILLNNKKLYILNIRNMEIKQIYLPFLIVNIKDIEYKSFISSSDYINVNSFIYKNRDNIYIYIKGILYYINYINNEFQFIKSFEFDQLKAINYLSNKYNKLNNIEINCLYNFDFKEIIHDLIFFYLNNNKDRISYCRPYIEIKKALNIKKFFFKKELRHKIILINNKKTKKYKDIFIMKKNLKTKKIVNYSNSFKKKYR